MGTALAIPEVGMARMIRSILAIQLLGHRRTCPIAPTRPIVGDHPVGLDDMTSSWGLQRRKLGGTKGLRISLSRRRGYRRFQHCRPKCGRAMMDRIVVAVAIGMGLVFGTGIMVGIVAMIATAVRREDRRSTLTRTPPGPAARGVRRLVGVGLRDIYPPDGERRRS
jgi:hypothetical protein